jgi:IS5 family transposase
LLREAQVNLAIRWFAGYRLHEQLPDHSSLTRIRQRWGAARFKQIFCKSVAACGRAGLVDGQTVHLDASLIRADVSWESLTERHVERVLADNAEPDGPPAPKRPGRPRTAAAQGKKSSPTDPDATLTTSCKQYRMEPCYKQHTAVDDRAGVIVDVAVTTGEASEGLELPRQLARVEAQTGVPVQTVTADGAYAHGRNYEHLEQRGTTAVIPPQTEARTARRIPARRFKYDARHPCVRCPAGKVLHRSTRNRQGWVYRARAGDCRACPLRTRCIAPSAAARVIVIGDGYESLLARRGCARRGQDAAWPAARGATRLVECSDSGVPDGGRDESEAPGGVLPRAARDQRAPRRCCAVRRSVCFRHARVVTPPTTSRGLVGQNACFSTAPQSPISAALLRHCAFAPNPSPGAAPA